jgi:hypothetical protein
MKKAMNRVSTQPVLRYSYSDEVKAMKNIMKPRFLNLFRLPDPLMNRMIKTTI